MAAKLYIINNGLKDLRGHYHETSLAVAEAARDRGLHPILAAHVACPDDLMPGWLEFYPVFTTDHWMATPPPPPPPLHGLRGQWAPLLDAPAEGLGGGSTHFRQFLEARFDPPCAMSLPRRCLAWMARRLLPAPLYRPTRAVAVTLGRILAAPMKRLQPLVETLSRRLGSLMRSWKRHPDNPLANDLGRAGLAREYEYAHCFRRDLERLLVLTGCQAQDHVFLP